MPPIDRTNRSPNAAINDRAISSHSAVTEHLPPSLPDAGAIWQDCLETLRHDLPAQAYNTWLRPLRPSVSEQRDSEGTRFLSFLLIAPNRFIQDWVKAKLIIVDFPHKENSTSFAMFSGSFKNVLILLPPFCFSSVLTLSSTPTFAMMIMRNQKVAQLVLNLQI